MQVRPPLMCSLLDQVPEPKVTQPVMVQPYSSGLAELAEEKGAAQLSQCKSYLTDYTKAVSIKEGKSALSFLQRQRGREERMVVTEITVGKNITEYTVRNLLDLWKLLLIETLEIPEDCIEFCLARGDNTTTTLVFNIAQTYVKDIRKKVSKLAVMLVMNELGIVQVCIAEKVGQHGPSRGPPKCAELPAFVKD